MRDSLELPVDIFALIPITVVLFTSHRVYTGHGFCFLFNFIQSGVLAQWFHAPLLEEHRIIMDDAIAAAIRQSPLVIGIPRSPAAPLLEVITGPYILESGIVGDPWIQVLEIAAPSILKCAGHQIDTGFLRLDHRLGFRSIARCTGS